MSPLVSPHVAGKAGFPVHLFWSLWACVCKSCVEEYFNVQIKNGSVKNICSPEENFTSEAVPSHVIIYLFSCKVFGM